MSDNELSQSDGELLNRIHAAVTAENTSALMAILRNSGVAVSTAVLSQLSPDGRARLLAVVRELAKEAAGFANSERAIVDAMLSSELVFPLTLTEKLELKRYQERLTTSVPTDPATLKGFKGK